MIVNGVSMIFALAWRVIEVAIGCRQSYMRYWLYFNATEKVRCSLPHSETERQQSVNHFSSCKSGIWKVICSLLCISVVLAVFEGQRDCDTLPAWSWKWASTEHQSFLALHDGKSKRKMAANVYIWSFDWIYRLKCSGSLSSSIEIELCCDCPGGCCGTISCLSAYKGCQNRVYRCLRSFTTKITQDSRPKIIVTLLTLMVKMGQGECSILFCRWRWPMQWL